MNFQPSFSTNDHSANDLDHLFPVIWWLFFALMQLDGLFYLYILFRRRNNEFFVGYCARVRNLMLARFSRAGPVNAITWKISSPVSRDPDITCFFSCLPVIKDFLAANFETISQEELIK